MHFLSFKKNGFVAILLLTTHLLTAQTFAESVIRGKDSDSVKVSKLYDWLVYQSKQDLSEDLANAEHTLAFVRGLANAWQRARLELTVSVVFTRHGQLEKAEQVILSGLANAKLAKDPSQVATAYRNLVRIYASAKDELKRARALEKLDSIVPYVTDPLFKVNTLVFLCQYYGSIDQYGRIGPYVYEAKALTDKYGLALVKPHVTFHLSMLARARGQLDSAVTYLVQAREGYRAINDAEEAAGMTLQLAQMYALKGQPELAQREMQFALDQVVASKDTLGIVFVSMEQGKMLSGLQQTSAAEAAFKKSEALGNKPAWKVYQKQLYTAMANHYERTGQFEESLTYYKKATVLRDSFESIETLNKVKELETRYETRKKETAIQQLDQENRNKNLQLGLLGTALALLVITGAAGYFFVRNRQRRVLLDNQKQWAKAVVESTDTERRRIASDLHDGVAQQLATLKMLSSGLIDHTAEAGAAKLQTLRSEIDATSKEVRQMAHRMIPRNLDAQGLPDALEDLLFIQFQDAGIKTQLNTDAYTAQPNQEIDTALYRIAQEACNNIIKHAEATAVSITLSGAQTGPVSMLLEDNGKGMANVPPGTYTVAQLPVRKTLGLRSMESRAGLVGGTIQFERVEQGGMRIWVQINTRT
jgi:signal transduction histidine kinase